MIDEMLSYCSRCGQRWKLLGSVLRYGKHYPAFTIKHISGKVEHRDAVDEIKEAVCSSCLKELYDKSKKELC